MLPHPSKLGLTELQHPWAQVWSLGPLNTALPLGARVGHLAGRAVGVPQPPSCVQNRTWFTVAGSCRQIYSQGQEPAVETYFPRFPPRIDPDLGPPGGCLWSLVKPRGPGRGTEAAVQGQRPRPQVAGTRWGAGFGVWGLWWGAMEGSGGD